jgi:hypothetical protein
MIKCALPYPLDAVAHVPRTGEAVSRNAGNWLLHSGIQEPSGGVARFYRADQERNAPISTEITGYAASTYAWLHRVTSDAAFLDAAQRTARFLVESAWIAELETFPFECIPGSPAYFFDCGIITRGLLAVWRLTGDARLLDVAVRCGRSMARDFLTAEAIHPAVSLPAREPLPYERRWSREPGCFQLKAALAWRDLHAATDDAVFLEWWETAKAFALRNSDSFLPGAAEPDKVMDRLHAYCYFLEALLSETESADSRRAISKGIDRVARHLREIAPKFARSDVYGQLLRIRLLAEALGVRPLDRAGAAQEAATLPGFQYHESDPRLDGGFCFGLREGARLPFANPVSTGFCVQALDWWQRSLSRGEPPSLDNLI